MSLTSAQKRTIWRGCLILGLVIELALVAVSILSLTRGTFRLPIVQSASFLAIGIWIYIAYLKQRHLDIARSMVDEKVKTHALLDGLRDAVVLLDSRGVFLAVNKRAEDLLGLTETSWSGIRLSGFLDPGSRRFLESGADGELDGALASGAKVRLVSTRVDTQGGESEVRLVHIHSSASPDPASAATPAGPTTAVTGSVPFLCSVISEVMRAAGTCLASVGDPETRGRMGRACLKMMAGEASLSLGERVAQAPETPTDVPVEAVLDAALNEVGPAAEAAGVAVDRPGITIAGQGFCGDALLIGGAVRIVVLNAILATGPGGRVSLKMAPMGSNLGLAVIDGGAAVSSENLPDLFDAGNGMGARGGGCIGYLTARRAVEALGGTLVAESAGKQGLRIMIMLPARGA